MASNRTSSRRVFRWECSAVELIPVEVEMSEYTARLARIAEELYSLMNQLHTRSYSLIHPVENLEPKSVALAAEHKGVCDGEKSIHKAA